MPAWIPLCAWCALLLAAGAVAVGPYDPHSRSERALAAVLVALAGAIVLGVGAAALVHNWVHNWARIAADTRADRRLAETRVEPRRARPAPLEAAIPDKPSCDAGARAAYVAPILSEENAAAAAHKRKLKTPAASVAAGPIIGAVSDRSASVWIKADRPAAWVLELTQPGRERWSRRIAGPDLTPTRDLVGVIQLDQLEPHTRYDAQIKLRELTAPASSTATDERRASLRTLPAAHTRGHVRIAFGADIDHAADQPIFTQIAATDPDAVFFIGDQLYADEVRPNYASFAVRYTGQWRIRQLAELMSHYPTFMMWDDHEIADDYYPGKSERYAPARLAYELYVQSHNPAPLRPGKLYYTQQLGDVGFFVLDVRSERSDPRAPETLDKTMLGAEQKADLLQWLACDSSRIKVLVSPVAWGDSVTGDDAWLRYPTEREQLLRFIERERIDDVLILSGDQHWSAVFRHDRPGLRVLEFLATPLSKARKRAPTQAVPEILARDDDNFVFGVVDFDTRAAPASVVFTLCALGKPCRPGEEPAPASGLNQAGAAENVPFSMRFTSDDFGLR